MLFILMTLAVIDPATRSQGPAIAWSPDGRWVAYLQVVRSLDQSIKTGWLLGEETSSPANPKSPITKYRIWATRVDTGESVRLAESIDPLSSPCWHPDGKAVAFERVTAEGPGRFRLDLMIQDGTETSHNLWSHPIDGPIRDPADGQLAMIAPTWSLDGRLIAISDPNSTTITIVRVADGRTFKSIEGGFLPSWSDDGKLAFFRTGAPDGLFWMDAHMAVARRIADAPESAGGPAPFWSRDGLSIQFVRRGPTPKRLPFMKQATDGDPALQLVRVRIDTGQVDASDALLHDPVENMQSIRGVAVALNRDSGEICAAIDLQDIPSQILTLRPHNQTIEVLSRSNPVDFVIPVGNLSLSPTARRLAVRMGRPRLSALPAITEPSGATFSPIVPDESARIEWVSAMVGLARGLLSASKVPGDRNDRRPSLVPLPGILLPDDPITSRIRRAAAIGRPLCDLPNGSTADTSTRAYLAESRLFFDLLLADYGAALADLSAYSPSATTPDRRARLLGLRAQIDLGLGEVERARSTIDYLRTTSGPDSHRIEETAAGGFVITPLPGSTGWIAGLSEAISARSNRATAHQPVPGLDPSRSDSRSMNAPAIRPEQDLPIVPDPIPIMPIPVP